MGARFKTHLASRSQSGHTRPRLSVALLLIALLLPAFAITSYYLRMPLLPLKVFAAPVNQSISLRIHEIQGSGSSSPYAAGKSVSLTVLNPDGARSAPFTFVRPAN